MRKTAVVLALASGLAGVSSAFANPPDERALWEALQASAMRTDRMATKTDSMKGMHKEEAGKATRRAEDVSKLLDPNIANP